MTEKPFGIDLSKYQGMVDWDVVAAHEPKVRFVGIRATVNWGYTDSWFSRNWSSAKNAGILRTAYHVIFPGESTNRQMTHFLSVVGDDLGELPLTLDIELDHGYSYAKIRDSLYACASILESNTGKKPIIYSRALWVDEHVTGPAGRAPLWLDQYKWWLAQYLRTPDEHPGPPAMPKGVSRENVIIHQTTQKGIPFGVETKQLDYDRWQGDLDSMYQFAGVKPPEDGTKPPSIEERVLALEAQMKALQDAARSHEWTI
jgi:GH25 family lysozyme M1 (1,4-beta-N-acetylmuramidase)